MSDCFCLFSRTDGRVQILQVEMRRDNERVVLRSRGQISDVLLLCFLFCLSANNGDEKRQQVCVCVIFTVVRSLVTRSSGEVTA